MATLSNQASDFNANDVEVEVLSIRTLMFNLSRCSLVGVLIFILHPAHEVKVMILSARLFSLMTSLIT